MTVVRYGGNIKYKRQQKQAEKFHGRELYAMTVARQQ
jgi:S-adenosylmethionine hydrolase